MKSAVKACIVGAALALTACSSVTIQPEQGAKIVSEPDYQQSKPFFLWGLAGEHRIDVAEVCGGNEPRQMQSLHTPVDGVLNIVTLGIYAPLTARVWC
ncbi:Bor family protein [Aliidiomarina minuta]|uniref:Bor family protein n=1 Tax=Aliidiomarina minuta TaxID=880057 RepID=A0A432W3H9_9GAMM|nr:Bor family protein [Aliidiomarina minuta]RUO23910.1 Bor family protein [Aliidiomarina minuta]